MRILWTTIGWFAVCLVAGAAFGNTSSVPLPSIHLVRVNDPSGMEGFDLQCTAGEGEKAEPECTVTEVKASKTVLKSPVAFERAQKLAAAFLGKMPKEKIYNTASTKPHNPPVGDVLVVWNVRLGRRGTDGILKRNPPEAERDGALKQAVLLLESELGTKED